MSDVIKFKCFVATTNPNADLAMQVMLDGKSMASIKHVEHKTEIVFDIPDDESQHKLEFIMSGKKPEHTKVDQDGKILSDAMLNIDEVTIDDISLQALLPNLAPYSHDFNGSQKPVLEKFYGNMGCNGTVTLEFTTPFYLWLLEHL